MKNLKNIFSSLLLIALAIFISGCNSTHSEATVETTAVHQEHIEIEETIETTEATLPTETEAPIETLPKKTRATAFDKDTTYEISFIDDGEIMPYALLTPSTANDYTDIPLIVWLHDRNEQNLSTSDFAKTGILGSISNWNLENFNAYIICPLLQGNYYAEYWCNPKTKTDLTNLLAKFISEHDIDKEKITVAGASLGAQGALYMSAEMDEYFTRGVIFSGYSCGIPCSEIEIPVVGYRAVYGELEEVTYFMTVHFASSEKCLCKKVKTNHYELPEVVFNTDRDENGRADIIEWMLCKDPNRSCKSIGLYFNT